MFTTTTLPKPPGHATMERPESDLIRACQRGSEDAFRELVERFQRRAYWIARNLVRNDETAKDVTQEAFLRVFRNILRFDLQKNFYTWLCQIVVNLSIDHLRKVSHVKSVDLDVAGGIPDLSRPPDREAGKSELRERVQQALDRLPVKYKVVLTLRDIHGLSCEEIAAIAGCTNPTVRWRLHRARQLFRSVWTGKPVGVEVENESEAEGEEGSIGHGL